MRTFATLLVVGVTTLSLHAGDDGLAGNWKVMLLEDHQLANPWLIRVKNMGGKWTAEPEALKGMAETKLTDFKIAGDLIQFQLQVTLRGGVATLQFEGRIPRVGAKKILGSITANDRSMPAYLEATPAKNGFELDRELLTRSPNDPRVFGAVVDLIGGAKEKKISTKEVQEWLDTVLRNAEGYGPRFQQDYTKRLIEALAGEQEYAALAEKLLPKDSPAVQLNFLATYGSALKKAGKSQQLKDIEPRIEKLELPAFAEYAKTALGFTPAKFAGRKGKSDRAVLIELFTGAMCPPCVAADLAFDAVEKAFPAKDVVLLQYHLHVPGPDALTNSDCEKRGEFYGRTLRGTPTIYFNGKADKNVQGGGERGDAEEKYKEYREALASMLEKPAGVQLEAKAVRQGDKIAIQASVKDLARPGEATRLRLVLVEDWVRYKSRNGMLYHHRVVRALPGGAAGLALTKANVDHAVTVDLGELRTSLNKYLDDFAKNEAPFPDAERPMRLRNLHVVAFVQHDDSYEVLQAVDVAVTEE